MKLSIIVPTRRFDESIAQRLAAVQRCLPAAELLVVEPDDLARAESRERPSTALSPAASGPAAPRRLSAPRGRGTQCDRGARAAGGDLLMFLHDDTELPPDAESALRTAFADPAVGMTCFRLAFDRRHWLLAVYAWLSRFETRLTTFGDQAMVVRRRVYESVGGFPPWPLFEDVELARRVRRVARVRKLPGAVTTSAVRFARHGMLRQQLINGVLLARFFLGDSPARLAAIYEAGRTPIAAGRPK